MTYTAAMAPYGSDGDEALRVVGQRAHEHVGRGRVAGRPEADEAARELPVEERARVGAARAAT